MQLKKASLGQTEGPFLEILKLLLLKAFEAEVSALNAVDNVRGLWG